jgi:hypothetical protein
MFQRNSQERFEDIATVVAIDGFVWMFSNPGVGCPVEWVAHGATVEITIASHLGTATSSQQLVDSLNIEQRAKV